MIFFKKICFSKLALYGLIVITISISSGLFAEGTKQIQPTPASHGRLQLMPFVTDFAIFGAAQEHRLHITICNLGEKIYYGFGHVRNYDGIIQYDIIYRIKDPNGNIVVGPAPIPYSGPGFISTYQQAVSGPNIINPGGYNPLVYTPLITGDYFIEFSFTQPYGYERKIFDLIDVSVLSANNQVIDGRLWSKNWQLTTNPMTGYSSPYQAGYDGVMFIYADDGVVTSIDLNNMQPFVFNITANQSGCFNTGNFLQDRKSTDGNHTYPQYRIFLNDPDSNCFPTGHLGNFTAPTTISGCPGQFCINVYVDKQGNIELLLDLNGTPGYQPNTEDVLLGYNVSVGHNCIPWDGLDGLGNAIAPGQSINIELNYFNGLTHLPIYDVEGNVNGFKVEIVRPYNPNPVPALFWDDSDIPGGTMQLAGCTDPNGCHTWPIGTCLTSPVPTYCSMGDMRTINTWWYAHAITDNAVIELQYPLVNANIFTPTGQNDTLICIENNQIQLNGSVDFAPSGLWTGGTGQFSPSANDLQAVYTLSQSELDSGYVSLVLTSTGSTCPEVNDTLNITIIQAMAIVNPDKTICKGDAVVLTAGGGQTYSWSPPTFLNNSDIASPTAYPTQNISYTVSITDAHGCTASNSVSVFVEDIPEINFLPDTTRGCKPLKVNFLSLSPSSLSHYSWHFGDAASGFANTSAQAHPTHTYHNSGTYTVTLSVTSLAGCKNQISYTNLITVYPQPTAAFYTNPKEGDADNKLINFINESHNAVAWHWNFGNENDIVNNTSTLEHPQYTYNEPGIYEVWLHVVSPDGCLDSISRDIIIRGEFTLYVPNAFTPNGDGINDYFMPYGIELDNNRFTMYIYNRWGEKVFKTDDINKPWDGTVRNTGNKAPQEVYVWIIYTENYIIGRQKYVGHVTLLR